MNTILAVLGVLTALAALGIVLAYALQEKQDPTYRRLRELAGPKQAEKRAVPTLEDELEGTFYQRVIEPIISRLAKRFTKSEKSSSTEKLANLLVAAGNPGDLGPGEFRAVQFLCAAVSMTAVLILGILIGLTPRTGETNFSDSEFKPPLTVAAFLTELKVKFPDITLKKVDAKGLNSLLTQRDFYAALGAKELAATTNEELNKLLAERAKYQGESAAFPKKQRLNRLLLEHYYPNHCPKNHGMEARQIFGLTVAAMCLAGGLSFVVPQFWLKSKITQRVKQIQKTLPDAIDLLVVSVEAGLGFDMAMGKVVEKTRGALADEFGRALEEMRLGYQRAQALKNITKRVRNDDLDSFISAIIQADQLGTSIGQVLRIQSEQMRVKRKQRIEEAAMKAPIKMLFPMVLFIFPTIFIIILGPIVIKVQYEKANIGRNMDTAAKKPAENAGPAR